MNGKTCNFILFKSTLPFEFLVLWISISIMLWLLLLLLWNFELMNSALKSMIFLGGLKNFY